MIPYLLLFLYFAIGALVEHDRGLRPRRPFFLILGAYFIAGMIGFRYKVGADWDTYRQIFAYSRLVSASRMVVALGDPAYALLTWAVSHLGGRIWGVNLVCGAIFAWGLQRFARAQANPWLALVMGIPYSYVSELARFAARPGSRSGFSAGRGCRLSGKKR